MRRRHRQENAPAPARYWDLRYELYQDRKDPRRFVFVQRWADEESQRKHDKESAHIKEFTKNHIQKVESADIYQLTLVK